MIFGTELWPSSSHQKNAILTRQLPSLTAPRRQIEWSSVQSLGLSHVPGGCVPSLMTQPLIRSSLRALLWMWDNPTGLGVKALRSVSTLLLGLWMWNISDCNSFKVRLNHHVNEHIPKKTQLQRRPKQRGHRPVNFIDNTPSLIHKRDAAATKNEYFPGKEMPLLQDLSVSHH